VRRDIEKAWPEFNETHGVGEQFFTLMWGGEARDLQYDPGSPEYVMYVPRDNSAQELSWGAPNHRRESGCAM
jgi:hypothetical protein